MFTVSARVTGRTVARVGMVREVFVTSSTVLAVHIVVTHHLCMPTQLVIS